MQNTDKKPSAKIGLNRKLLNIQLNPFLETEVDLKLDTTQDLEENNVTFQNPNEYSGFVIYDEYENFRKNSFIDIRALHTILSYDERSNETDISKNKGEWKSSFEKSSFYELLSGSENEKYISK